MTKNSKIALGISAVVVLATVGVLVWNYNQNKPSEDEPQPKADPDNDTGDLPSSTTTDVGFGDGNLIDEPIPPSPTAVVQEEIKSNLRWVDNPTVAIYLAGKLSDAKISTLRGWVDLIIKERAEDSSKWQETQGLTGQVMDIASALYQMNIWNNDILYALQDAQ